MRTSVSAPLGSHICRDLEERQKSARHWRHKKYEIVDQIEEIRQELDYINRELEGLCYVDEASNEKKRLMAQGKRRFNSDPKKGVEFLMERQLIAPTPDSVAKFLLERCSFDRGVNKAAIGEYIGLNDDFALLVLRSFCKLQKFENSHIADALRKFLATFRLPGESQKIERILGAFAKQYVDVNPNVFDNADVAHIIAYSAIMLNTLLYNPNVKDKPTLEAFVSMNKNAVDLHGLSLRIVQNVYESVKDEEFKVPGEATGFFDEEVDFEGSLWKQSSSFLTAQLSWKKKWFVLSGSFLFYYESKNDPNIKGKIPLQDLAVKRCDYIRPHSFELYSKTGSSSITTKSEVDSLPVIGKHSSYRVAASSDEEAMKWMRAIQHNIVSAFPSMSSSYSSLHR